MFIYIYIYIYICLYLLKYSKLTTIVLNNTILIYTLTYSHIIISNFLYLHF